MDTSTRSSGRAAMNSWESQESERGTLMRTGGGEEDEELKSSGSQTQRSSSHKKSRRRSSADLVKAILGRKQGPQGKMVHGYELCGSLGSGSFATVEKCKKDGEVYAVKIFERSVLARKRYFGGGGTLRGGMKKPKSALDKVEEEIAIMKRLNFDHPNLVRMVEALIDENEDRIYMFMEFVDFGPVMNFDEDERKFSCALKGEGPCDPDRAAIYLHDIATGLAVMHAHRIAHRDLKPANVLLSKDKRAKISDFGVARHFQSLDGDVNIRTSQITAQQLPEDDYRPSRLAKLQRSQSQYQVKGTEGTYAYFAPEMLKEDPFNALACDLWALGVCGYNFLLGELPFPQLFTDDLFAAIAQAEPDFSSLQEHDQERHLLQALMHPDPKQRASLHDVTTNEWVQLHLQTMDPILPHSQSTQPGSEGKVPMSSFSVVRKVKQMLGSLDESAEASRQRRRSSSDESTRQATLAVQASTSSDDKKNLERAESSASSASSRRRKSIVNRVKQAASSTRKRFLSTPSSSTTTDDSPPAAETDTSTDQNESELAQSQTPVLPPQPPPAAIKA